MRTMAKHHPDLIFCRKQAGVGETASMPAALWVGVVLGAGGSWELGVPVSSSGFTLEMPHFPPYGGIGARGFVACDEKRWRACSGTQRRAGGRGGVQRNSEIAQDLEGASGGCGFGKFMGKREMRSLRTYCSPCSCPPFQDRGCFSPFSSEP